MQRTSVGIVIFEDVEVLDFCGPFEVFSVTRSDPDRRRETASPFDVLLVARDESVVTTAGGMRVLPHTGFATCPPLDILVVPGGWGTRALLADETMLGFVRQRAAQAQLVTSVCTGSLVLGTAGLLDGLAATTHFATLDFMQELLPRVQVDRTSHIVEHDTIMTSAGISAGIDMALRVVARRLGEAVARDTARYMEYPYPESNARRV